MVAFVTSDLPPNIVTVEQLTCWGLTVLNDLAGNLTYEPDIGVVDFVAQCSPVQIYRGPNAGWRLESRTSFPMVGGEWRRTGKIWAQVTPIIATPLPAAYRAA
ncbi:hypothetical protein [Leptolyngbya sp. AN02str]|uniref:hypothetical protein n=1 Tax=Leptolyngbya sp. AN02str TaxID=3423363 RepID=UPI003D31A713